jgi:hypothetical protein
VGVVASALAMTLAVAALVVVWVLLGWALATIINAMRDGASVVEGVALAVLVSVVVGVQARAITGR